MTTLTGTPAGGSEPQEEDRPAVVRGRAPDRDRTAGGRFVRRVWRIHFYAGVLAGPLLLLLALTGLVILYTDPIQQWTQSDLRTVQPSGDRVPLADQVAAAQRSEPELRVATVIPPRDATASTLVQFDTGGGLRDVFVDPYSGRVLGAMTDGDDIVGLANRLHGFLNNDSVTLTLPSLSHWMDPDAHPDATVEVPVAALLIEIMTVWALVLAISGMYLWWPRRSQRSKPLVKVRWSKGGRLRWRDLHASSGVVVAGVLAFFVVSGMPWSDYWGTDWATASSKITPSKTVSAPVSPVATVGDYDRLGRRIAWADRTAPVPLSTPAPSGGVPARMSYTDVARIARSEGMVPGFSIIPPDDTVTGGTATYGSFMVMNHWPQKLSERRSIYLDQFTGATLVDTRSSDDGALARATDLGVNTHMGTQFGVWSRIAVTAAALLLIFSVVSGYVMWWKRRPSGSVGLPRRQLSTPVSASVLVVAVVLGLLYPAFGASVIVVALVDMALRGWGGRRRRRAPSVTGSDRRHE